MYIINSTILHSFGDGQSKGAVEVAGLYEKREDAVAALTETFRKVRDEFAEKFGAINVDASFDIDGILQNDFCAIRFNESDYVVWTLSEWGEVNSFKDINYLGSYESLISATTEE